MIMIQMTDSKSGEENEKELFSVCVLVLIHVDGFHEWVNEYT